MKVLILANGDPPPAAGLRRLAAAHDLVIATDGAAHAAAARGVAPAIISGDFDSLRLEEARAAFPDAEFLRTPDQDLGDLEKAVRLARERGAASITLTGTGGGRVDHQLGNFSLLWRYASEFPLRIVEDGSETRALAGTNDRNDRAGAWALATRPGDRVSLISLDGAARVTVRGVQWPLEDFPLPAGTQGVSNRALGTQVAIEARGGVLLACHLFARAGAAS